MGTLITPQEFLYSWPGYYYKIGFWLYTNNEPFENVVKHPSKPDWGTLYLERKIFQKLWKL